MSKGPDYKDRHVIHNNGKIFLFDVPTMRLFLLENDFVIDVLDAFDRAIEISLQDHIPLNSLHDSCKNYVIQNLCENRIELDPKEIDLLYDQLLESELIHYLPSNVNEPSYTSVQALRYLSLIAPVSFTIAKKAISLLINKKAENKHRVLIFGGSKHLLSLDELTTIIKYSKKQAKLHNCKLDIIIDVNPHEINDETITLLKDPFVLIRMHFNEQSLAQSESNNLLFQLTQIKKRNIEAILAVEDSRIDIQQDITSLRKLGFRIIELESQSLPPLTPIFDKCLQDQYLIPNVTEIAASCHLRLYRWHHCTAGFAYFAVTPEGAIYPCPHLREMAEYKIGDVDQGISQRSACSYINKTVVTKAPCMDCWARYLCGGECIAKAEEYKVSPILRDNECDKIKSFIENSLVWYATSGQNRRIYLDVSIPLTTRFHPHRVFSLSRVSLRDL